MNFDEAREIVLQILRTKGKAKNSEMLQALGGDTGLLEQVREDLLFNDLAEDKKGVGLIYTGPALRPELSNEPAAAAPIIAQAAAEAMMAAEPQPVVSRRIFLSYGHDEHAALARRLKQDLEGRGHQVWFDEERLLPGEDWETCIERGLEWVAAEAKLGRVVLLMTPHAVRRADGYCLNELARALERSLPVVPVMVVWCESPLSICRIQWLDMQDCVPIDARHARYEIKFVQLALALERDELAFEGVRAKLHALLDPLPFDADTAQHLTRFTGRQWVFDQIDAWLRDPAASRVFWITGAPGVGKTAIAAWLCEHRPEVVAFHLCRHGHIQKSDPRRCVLSIAYQLSTQLADYQDRLNQLDLPRLIPESDARTLFDRLIVQPLSANFPRPEGIVVVLIDALDEATTVGRNELASFLATEFRRTPDWLRLVITSRPDPEVTYPLQAYTPHVLNASSPDNEDDIRAFLRRELKPFTTDGGEVPEAVIEAMLARSEGVFLYVEWVRQEVADGRLSLIEPARFPKGLGEVYAQYIARQFPDVTAYTSQIAPALDAIAAAREPLELSMLAAMFGWGERRRHEFHQSLGSLFTSSGGRILPFHKSVLDWLTSADKAGPYFVSIEEGHQALATLCWEQYRRGLPATSPYALAHLPEHLIAAGRWEDLERLLCDLLYLEAKVQAGRVFELAGDFAAAVDALPADRPQRRILRLLDEAFRRDIHFIARHAQDYPQGLFQCLWNCGWWYDCPEAARHYDSPEDGRSLEGIRGDRVGPKLFTLLERWRRLKQEVMPGFLWLRARRPPPLRLGSSQKAVLRGHTRCVESVSYSPDGRQIVSGSWDNAIRVWDAQSGAELAVLRGHASPVYSVSYSPDSRQIASGSSDHTLRLWDALRATELAVFRGHTSTICSVSYSPDGRQIASGSSDHTVRVWDALSGVELAVLRGHEGLVACVSYSPDGRWIASGSLDKTVRVWDAESGSELAVLHGHEGGVCGVSYSPDGRRIASGSLDKTVRVWDAESGRELTVLRGHVKPITAVSYSPDGRRIVSGSLDKTVRVWDAEDGMQLAVLRGHERGVYAVSYSPDGQRIASGSLDETVRLWDAEDGAESAILRGHNNRVTCVSYSPDGRRIVSGSLDKTARIWDAQSGTELVVLRGHSGGVCSVSYSPDGQRISSNSYDKTVRVWDAESGECLEVLAGMGNVSGIARGQSQSGHRAVSRGLETLIEANDLDKAIACFSCNLSLIAPAPSHSVWAGAAANHLYVIALECVVGTAAKASQSDNPDHTHFEKLGLLQPPI
jgi:WD40 repeat protein